MSHDEEQRTNLMDSQLAYRKGWDPHSPRRDSKRHEAVEVSGEVDVTFLHGVQGRSVDDGSEKWIEPGQTGRITDPPEEGTVVVRLDEDDSSYEVPSGSVKPFSGYGRDGVLGTKRVGTTVEEILADKSEPCPDCGSTVDLLVNSEEDEDGNVEVECSQCGWRGLSPYDTLTDDERTAKMNHVQAGVETGQKAFEDVQLSDPDEHTTTTSVEDADFSGYQNAGTMALPDGKTMSPKPPYNQQKKAALSWEEIGPGEGWYADTDLERHSVNVYPDGSWEWIHPDGFVEDSGQASSPEAAFEVAEELLDQDSTEPSFFGSQKTAAEGQVFFLLNENDPLQAELKAAGHPWAGKVIWLRGEVADNLGGRPRIKGWDGRILKTNPSVGWGGAPADSSNEWYPGDDEVFDITNNNPFGQQSLFSSNTKRAALEFIPSNDGIEGSEMAEGPNGEIIYIGPGAGGLGYEVFEGTGDTYVEVQNREEALAEAEKLFQSMRGRQSSQQKKAVHEDDIHQKVYEGTAFLEDAADHFKLKGKDELAANILTDNWTPEVIQELERMVANEISDGGLAAAAKVALEYYHKTSSIKKTAYEPIDPNDGRSLEEIEDETYNFQQADQAAARMRQAEEELEYLQNHGSPEEIQQAQYDLEDAIRGLRGFSSRKASTSRYPEWEEVDVSGDQRVDEPEYATVMPNGTRIRVHKVSRDEWAVSDDHGVIADGYATAELAKDSMTEDAHLYSKNQNRGQKESGVKNQPRKRELPPREALSKATERALNDTGWFDGSSRSISKRIASLSRLERGFRERLATRENPLPEEDNAYFRLVSALKDLRRVAQEYTDFDQEDYLSTLPGGTVDSQRHLGSTVTRESLGEDDGSPLYRVAADILEGTSQVDWDKVAVVGSQDFIREQPPEVLQSETFTREAAVDYVEGLTSSLLDPERRARVIETFVENVERLRRNSHKPTKRTASRDQAYRMRDEDLFL